MRVGLHAVDDLEPLDPIIFRRIQVTARIKLHLMIALVFAGVVPEVAKRLSSSPVPRRTITVWKLPGSLIAIMLWVASGQNVTLPTEPDWRVGARRHTP